MESLQEGLRSRNPFTKVIEDFLLVLLVVIGTFGNAVFCYVIAKNPRLRTPSNMLVLNLAISNILMAMVTMSLSLGVLITGWWPYGEIACNVQGISTFTFAIPSTLSMCAIAVSRYFAVVRPFLYAKFGTRWHLWKLILILWLVPLSASLPPLTHLVGNYKFHPGKAMCVYPFNSNIPYTCFLEILFVLMPAIVIVVSYWKCYIAMKRNSNRIAGMTSKNCDHRRKIKEFKITRMMMAATAGFTICWLPISVVDFGDLSTGGGKFPRQVYLMYMYLLYLTSTINPFIYWLKNSEFKEAFRKALACIFTTPQTGNSSEASPVNMSLRAKDQCEL